ncbi:hypothetical protein C8R46DRAFT_1230421 [Mycena filopes]|nr:hypothetical protein C8R46DRAFT_1230421 [Mycena filopes]
MIPGLLRARQYPHFQQHSLASPLPRMVCQPTFSIQHSALSSDCAPSYYECASWTSRFAAGRRIAASSARTPNVTRMSRGERPSSNLLAMPTAAPRNNCATDAQAVSNVAVVELLPVNIFELHPCNYTHRSYTDHLEVIVRGNAAPLFLTPTTTTTTTILAPSLLLLSGTPSAHFSAQEDDSKAASGLLLRALFRGRWTAFALQDLEVPSVSFLA